MSRKAPFHPGEYVETTINGKPALAFIPPVLTPAPPVINLQAIQRIQEEATLALGGLDYLAVGLPNPVLFTYMYVRKEALLSSQIEGTQSSLSELLLFEHGDAPGGGSDVREVSNYVKAMEHGWECLQEQGRLPLSLRLIKEIHEKLLADGRGGKMLPGEFRRNQNWIGDSRSGNPEYVPPPPGRVMELMADLEKFLHEKDSGIPRLLKAGIVHLQFESIHPFLDGNGRLGRLLIPFLLYSWGILKQPLLLYISLYFKGHRQRYYELLQQVRKQGDWGPWLEFFLQGIAEVSRQATETARKLQELFETDRQRIDKELGQAAASALALHEIAKQQLIFSVPEAAAKTGRSLPTIRNAVERLQNMDILRETTGKRRYRRFLYSKYMKIMEEGTEALDH